VDELPLAWIPGPREASVRAAPTWSSRNRRTSIVKFGGVNSDGNATSSSNPLLPSRASGLTGPTQPRRARRCARSDAGPLPGARSEHGARQAAPPACPNAAKPPICTSTSSTCTTQVDHEAADRHLQAVTRPRSTALSAACSRPSRMTPMLDTASRARRASGIYTAQRSPNPPFPMPIKPAGFRSPPRSGWGWPPAAGRPQPPSE